MSGKMLSQTPLLTLTDENFSAKVEQSQILILVDCWATWCISRHDINPTFDNLAVEFAGQITVGRLNVAESKHIAAKFGIRAVPTLLIFNHGRVIYRIIGDAPQNEIAQYLKTQLNCPNMFV
jgi:thioredoxin 1